MRKFDSKKFKKEIVKRYGSVSKLKKFLKESSVDEGYGCRIGEIEIDGVEVKYTSNPNHFAEFFVQMRHVGFTGTYALDRSSFTQAGKRRGAANFSPILK